MILTYVSCKLNYACVYVTRVSGLKDNTEL